MPNPDHTDASGNHSGLTRLEGADGEHAGELDPQHHRANPVCPTDARRIATQPERVGHRRGQRQRVGDRRLAGVVASWTTLRAPAARVNSA